MGLLIMGQPGSSDHGSEWLSYTSDNCGTWAVVLRGQLYYISIDVRLHKYGGEQ